MERHGIFIAILLLLRGEIFCQTDDAPTMAILNSQSGAIFPGADVDFNGNGTNITAVSPYASDAPSTAGHFEYNYTDNHICILFDASSINLQITYNKTDGETDTVHLKVAPTARVIPALSKCGQNLSDSEVNETLAISTPVVIENKTHNISGVLSLFFTRSPNITGDKTLDKSQLYKISFSFTFEPTVFPNVSSPFSTNTITSDKILKEFAVLKDRSYQCNSESSVKVDDELTVKFSGLRSQAFVTNDRFATAESCQADAQTSDLVPIIIGAVLAAIVLIILIAYLIGRARLRRTPYESI